VSEALQRRLIWLGVGLAPVAAAGVAGAVSGSAELFVGVCAPLAVALLVYAAARALEVMPAPKEDVRVRGAGVSYRPKIDSSDEWLARRLDLGRAERAFLMALPSLAATTLYAVLHGIP
jgi:hypothetical protein